jgi:hypothetical protein
MPKLPNKVKEEKVPAGMCKKCRTRASWFKSLENLCYWCTNNLKEGTNGNQPLQRSTNLVSASSRRLQNSNKSQDQDLSTEEVGKEPSLRKQIASKQLKPAGWKPYPKSVKGLPHNGAN